MGIEGPTRALARVFGCMRILLELEWNFENLSISYRPTNKPAGGGRRSLFCWMSRDSDEFSC